MVLGDQQAFVRSLLEWYHVQGRAFPWRDTNDPYRILVAELLLQRTKAEQVLPVYLEFLRRYPVSGRVPRTSTLLALIAPLGMRHRAGRIRTILARLKAEYGGQVPREPEKLEKLLGPGSRYTRDAVLALAFGEPVIPVDRTIARLLGRYFTGRTPPPGRPHSDAKILRLAATLSGTADSRSLFFALLDYSAAVCKPRPLCGECAVKNSCASALTAAAVWAAFGLHSGIIWLAGYLSHIALDCCTLSGCMPLKPISNRRVHGVLKTGTIPDMAIGLLALICLIKLW